MATRLALLAKGSRLKPAEDMGLSRNSLNLFLLVDRRPAFDALPATLKLRARRQRRRSRDPQMEASHGLGTAIVARSDYKLRSASAIQDAHQSV